MLKRYQQIASWLTRKHPLSSDLFSRHPLAVFAFGQQATNVAAQLAWGKKSLAPLGNDGFDLCRIYLDIVKQESLVQGFELFF